MLRIAVDIDNTLYNTRQCEIDISEQSRSKFPNRDNESILARIKYEDEIASATETWFNPHYLIQDAVEVLKSLSGKAKLFICTARQADWKYYDMLFKDTGLQFTGIIQRDDFPGKAMACLRNNIDFLVDDELRNFLEHRRLKERNPDYKTRFVYYTEYTRRKSLCDADPEGIALTMQTWKEFLSILYPEEVVI